MKHKRKWVFWLRWPLFMACSVGALLLGSHVVKFFHKFIVPYYHYPYKPVFLSVMISVQIMILTMIFSAWAIDVLLHKIAMDEIVEPGANKRENRIKKKYMVTQFVTASFLFSMMGFFFDMVSVLSELKATILTLIIGLVFFFVSKRIYDKIHKRELKAIKEMRLAEKQNTQTH